MPRFFFDTHSDLASFRDVEGMELASSEMAGDELIRALPGMLRDELPTVARGAASRPTYEMMLDRLYSRLSFHLSPSVLNNRAPRQHLGFP